MSEKQVLEEAFRFHGHKCWASTADGVQYATGCTLGKSNVDKTHWGKLALTLIDKKTERAVRVSYKGTHQKRIASSAFMRKRGQGIPPSEIPEDEAWEMVSIVWDAPEQEVLSVGGASPFPFKD